MCIMPNTTLAFPFKNILGQQIRICKHEPKKKAMLSNLQIQKKVAHCRLQEIVWKMDFSAGASLFSYFLSASAGFFAAFFIHAYFSYFECIQKCKQDNYSISLIESWGSNHPKVWSSCLRSNLNKLSKNLLKLWYWLWLQTNFATLVRKGLHCIKP